MNKVIVNFRIKDFAAVSFDCDPAKSQGFTGQGYHFWDVKKAKNVFFPLEMIKSIEYPDTTNG